MAEALICLFGMALHRGVFSWPVNAVPEEEQLQGQWLRREPCQPRASGLLCSCCPVGAEGKESDGGCPAGLLNFHFHGSPHRIVISLKCRGLVKKKSQTFCRTGKYFPPSS